MPWVSQRTDQYPTLTQSDWENNVTIIWNTLGSKGYTAEAVAAICGNMQAEGILNPGQYQIGSNYSLYYPWGSGLCGWTPTYNNPDNSRPQNNPHQLLGSWCDSQGLNHEDGDAQLAYLHYELTDWDGTERFFSNSQATDIGQPVNPPITAAQFMVSTDSVSTLSDYWLCYYEHPADLLNTYLTRRQNSARWYTFITSLPPPQPPTPPTPTQKKKMPIWMMCRRNYF